MSEIAWPAVPVLSHKMVRGWNGDETELVELQAWPLVRFDEVLSTKHESDAYLVAYVVAEPAGDDGGQQLSRRIPRLNRRAIPVLRARGCDVFAPIALLDVDDTAAHASGEPTTTAWREQLEANLRRVPYKEQLGLYWTRSGARLFAVYPKMKSLEDHVAFLASIAADLRRHGIEVDMSAMDFGRLFRVPFGVREDHPDWQLQTAPLLPRAVFTQTLPAARSRGLEFCLPEERCEPANASVPADVYELRKQAATKWMSKRPPAVEGCHGDQHTFNTACQLVIDHGLHDPDALSLLRAWNEECEPPWTEDELRQKLDNARSYGSGTLRPDLRVASSIGLLSPLTENRVRPLKTAS